MSPEVYNKKNISFSTDLYSLGLVMYKLLNANRLPFSSTFSNKAAILIISLIIESVFIDISWEEVSPIFEISSFNEVNSETNSIL